MIGDLVALGNDPAGNLGVHFDVAADDVKRCFDPPLGQRVEQSRGEGTVGAIIEGQGQMRRADGGRMKRREHDGRIGQRNRGRFHHRGQGMQAEVSTHGGKGPGGGIAARPESEGAEKPAARDMIHRGHRGDK